MKSIIISMLLTLVGAASYADGFVCSDNSNQFLIQAYNHTNPEQGTRNAAAMIISRNDRNHGERTIAEFKDEKNRLLNNGATYIAYVNIEEQVQRGAKSLLFGVDLSEVYSVVLDTKFNYSQPLPHGHPVDAELVIVKNNGDKVFIDTNCTRYLKNDSYSQITQWHMQ